MFGRRHRHPPFPGAPFGPGGFAPGPFGPWGPGRRARRGDIRLAMLSVLAEGPRHGYEVMRELEGRSGGRWRPSPGSVYPTLQLLEDEGLVRSEDLDGKRVYSITDAGRTEVESRGEHGGWRPPWEAVEGDPPVQDLWNAALGTLIAARQVSEAGTPDQQARALEVVQEARRKLYAILGEG